MEIKDYDGEDSNWYIEDLAHYNEEWLRWIISDLYMKYQELKEENN